MGQRGIHANYSRKSRTNDREGMDVKWKEEFQGFFQKAESRVLQEEAELSTEETD